MTQPAPSLPPPELHGPPLPPTQGELLWRHVRATMITGLVTLFPLFVTLYVVLFIFGLATRPSQYVAKALVPPLIHLVAAQPPEPPADQPPATDVEAVKRWNEMDRAYKAYNAQVSTIQEWTWPIMAIVISALVVYALGLLGNWVVGRRILAAFEQFVGNLPLVKGIYGTTKQVITVFRSGGGGQGFQRVVLVEFPRLGTWTIAFVTKTITDTVTGHRFVCCFIPLTPNPTSGYFQMFGVDQVRETGWTVDQGIKILLSGGLLAPSELSFGPPTAPIITPPTTPLTTAVPPAK